MKRLLRWVTIVVCMLSVVSCGGLLDEEDAYGKASNFTLQEIAPALSGTSFTILLITDVHVGRQSRVPDSYDAFGNMDDWVTSVTSSGSYDFLINLGDLTDDSTDSQYASAKHFYENMASHMNLGSFTTIGNHDNRRGGRRRFNEYLGSPMYQAFSFGGYSFYLLDTSDRSVSKAQLSKLKQALKNDSQPKLFLTHYPLAADSMSYYYLALTDSEEREELIDLMVSNKVGLWVAGHRHAQKGPVVYTSTCHEITLASLNGLDDPWESPPSWYVMTVDTLAKTVTFDRYEWHKGDGAGTKTDSFVFRLP